ncbi:aminodeoxychorismate synthase, component I [Alicyclobacillus sacchari]|nr:aminodeoxychorismate synthase, component I [Alicyclobacillus sacchari]
MGQWHVRTPREQYEAAVREIHEAIASGNTYQVNYSVRLQASFAGDDFAFYEKLRWSQRAPYTAYIRSDDWSILSISPELFFERNGSGIMTRPMKGTVKRGRTLTEDAELARWLQNSEKNRAENVMIVDLLRNDLGRVAVPGTVQVPSLFDVETYPTVLQMTSTIVAQLRDDVDLAAIFAALFPCGSITGAPKISTMSRIAQLETDPRGVYCGSVGLLLPRDRAIFNVAIRTIEMDRTSGAAIYGAGGGITWDSQAVDEYEELHAKAQILEDAERDFALLETLRLDSGEYALYSYHLQRLSDSARYFQIPVDHAEVASVLSNCVRQRPTGAWRVRLLVDRSGKVDAEIGTEPLPPCAWSPSDAAAKTVMPIALAPMPVSSEERWLYHKTTRREFYDAIRSQLGNAFDALLYNEAHEVTEFTFANLVYELRGRLYTPPVSCGLLPGTLRACLLQEGRVVERSLHMSEMKTVDRLWWINSVRGWVPVQLTGLSTYQQTRATGSRVGG